MRPRKCGIRLCRKLKHLQCLSLRFPALSEVLAEIGQSVQIVVVRLKIASGNALAGASSRNRALGKKTTA